MAVTEELNRSNDHTQCHILAEACESSLKQRDPSVVWSTLLVLDYAMKNCGPHFHAAVCNRRMMREMKRLITKYWGKKSGFGTANPIGSLAVQMLQLWTNSFSPRTYPDFSQAYYRLLEKGIHFPPPTEENKSPISGSAVVTKVNPKAIMDATARPSNTPIPRSVSITLDSVGESLSLLFSLTEDPTAPVPEDLLKPICDQLRTHSDKIVEHINANLGNENAVRRLLEVNDQIETALKRVSMHKNVVEEDSDSTSDESDSPPATTASFSNDFFDEAPTRKSIKSKSASAPNVADLITSPSSSSKPSLGATKKKKSSKKLKRSQTTAPPATSDLADFFAPPRPTGASHPVSTSSTTEFDAFDFTHSNSAFAPNGTTQNWADFGSSSAYAYPTLSQSLGSPPMHHHTSHAHSAFSPASPSALPEMSTSPFTTQTNAFEPFTHTNGHQASPWSSPVAQAPTVNGGNLGPNPFGVPSHEEKKPIGSPSANSERLAATFGKYWTGGTPASPVSTSLGPDPWSTSANSNQNGTSTFMSPGSPTVRGSASASGFEARVTVGGNGNVAVAVPVASTNPFL